MTYERLTEKDWHKEKFYPTTDNERVIRKRLWDLENKIENGTLIELPCKVGDALWVINECYIHKKEKCSYFIDNLQVETIEFNGRGVLLLCNNGGHYIWNKTVFLTREEAEERLKEKKNEKEKQ